MFSFGELGFRADDIILTFGPYFLLSLALTMDRKNWKILYQYPYIILLPVFTYFTITKKVILCRGATDSRLVFSPKFTYFNMLLSSIFVLRYVVSHGEASISINVVPLLTLLSAILTILFMHMSRCYCCGDWGCCNVHDDVHLYDADTGLVIQQGDQDVNNDDIKMAER